MRCSPDPEGTETGARSTFDTGMNNKNGYDILNTCLGSGTGLSSLCAVITFNLYVYSMRKALFPGDR